MRSRSTTRRTATTLAARPVPAPDVMAGMEYLDPPAGHHVERAVPQVSVQGMDPQRPSRALVPRVGLVLADGVERPDSVAELLAGVPAQACSVARLTFDVRPLRDVLEARVGWNVVTRLVDTPSDRGLLAEFRTAVTGGAGATALLESGDLDAEVGVVDAEGPRRITGRRHDLGLARIALTPFLADSEQLTRRLAETLGRPRDGAGRRCLEHTLALLVADAPIGTLLHAGGDAPRCAVPGSWPSEVGA